MKVYVTEEEFWPVLQIYKNKDDCRLSEELQIPEELYEEYKAAMTAFNEVQSKLEEIRDDNP